ncbi:MAG: hypothetical protein A2W91_11755 [Bacteroidetes bacterium GWF2_38_335]|nr:MAG: hypothetical protein A2W91_11755 [Bacteroidetes bacterium GWF2_38_335]OFY77954.1 MAG: hypothetical protein A2281_18500 [Bacteroidetes bacterium RIFOXYA12_FULL_38_20]HBS86695.1 hypothetical protein [Bacteroidales bacterium]
MFILFFLKTGCKDKKIVGVFWGEDIKIYYLYGSVVGIEIGQDKVQGQDFAYNINGWLKGINSNSLESKRDILYDCNIKFLKKMLNPS